MSETSQKTLNYTIFNTVIYIFNLKISLYMRKYINQNR
jgi:hypothetical protein